MRQGYPQDKNFGLYVLYIFTLYDPPPKKIKKNLKTTGFGKQWTAHVDETQEYYERKNEWK